MADKSIYQQASGYAPAEGPFTGILLSGLNQQPQVQQSYTGGSKTGQIAFLADQFLRGVQRGRMMSYIASEAKKSREYNSGLGQIDSQMQQVSQDPTLGDADKQARLNDLANIRNQYVTDHLSGAMGEGQGKGKGGKQKAKQAAAPYSETSAEGAPKASGGKQEGDSVGHQIGSALHGIMSRLAGPNMPESGTANLQWLQSRLYQNQQMSVGQGKQQAEQAWNTMLQSAAQRLGKPVTELTSEDIRQAPELDKVMDTYASVYPQGRGIDILNAKMGGFVSPEQQQQRAITKETLEDEKMFRRVSEWEAGGGAEEKPQGAQIYNPQTGGVQPLGAGTRLGPPPEAKPLPIAQRSQTETVASQFNSPDMEPFFGQALRISPYTKTNHNIVYAYQDRPNGQREVIGLTELRPGVLVESGTNRLFNARAAKNAGWRLSSASPRANPRETMQFSSEMINGKMYKTEYDRSTGRFRLSRDEAGNPILLRDAPGVDQMLKFNAQHIDNIVQTASQQKIRLNGQLNATNSLLTAAKSGAGTYASVGVEDRKKAVTSLEENVTRLKQELEDVDTNMKARLESLYRATGQSAFQNAINGLFPQDQASPGLNAPEWGEQMPDF